MKTWQILILSLSILLSIIASAFYLKYEPKTMIETNYGPVNLGSIFSEKVMVDVLLIDLSNDGKIDTLVKGGSYYDDAEKIHNSFVDIFDSLNTNLPNQKKLSYDTANPLEDNKLKLKITTYITYNSSNFKNTPYTLNIREKTYSLSKDIGLKEQVNKIVKDNINNTKANIAESLFITDKALYGFNETNK